MTPTSNQNLINTAHPVGEFLRVAMMGVKPYLFLDGREVKGSDLLLMQLLSKKLNFNYKLSFVPDFDKIVIMVGKNNVLDSTIQEFIFRLLTALMILGGVNSVRCITGLDLALKTK